MSQRDRSKQDRGSEEEPRRDPRGSERSQDQPGRRRGTPEFDAETFDLPPWGTQRQRPSSRDTGGRQAGQPPARTPSREPAPGGSRREPLPTLGDAFRRPNRRQEAEPDDRSPSSTRDPYDRLRRVAARPPRAIENDAGDEFDDSYLGGFAPGEYDDLPPVPREQRSRRRAPASTNERRATAPRTPATQQIGGLIAAAAPQTRLIVGIGGFALLSLVFMAATVAGRMSSLPDWMPIHLNAEGRPDLWGSSSTLWRIPLMAVMMTLMSAGVAWYLWKRDPFAARFTLASTVLIHALTWVALINLVW